MDINKYSGGELTFMNILAGIVLYNPSIDRLIENISAVCSQVDKVVLVDNGSKNLPEISALINNYRNVSISIICNSDNMGIARALNQIFEIAAEEDYEWVLSLDQDSVVQPELIKEYRRYLMKDKANIAMFTCYVQDRNFEYEEKMNLKCTEVDFCITSACLLSIADWKAIGKYDEAYFIDRVDMDMCHRLRVAGKKIVKIPYVGLLHEIGENSNIKHLLWRNVTVFNHSPFRMYYIVRNSIYYAYKHRKTDSFIANYLAGYNRILVALLYEKNKTQKLISGLKGVIDGHKMILRKKRNVKRTFYS